MSVCFGFIVRVRINQRCVCVTSVVLVRFAPGDPCVRVVSLVLRSASCAGFSNGLYPVGFEGRIHYMGEVIPRGTPHASFLGLLCGFRSILYGAVTTATAPRGGLSEVQALELPPLVVVALPPLVVRVLSIILAGLPGAVER